MDSEVNTEFHSKSTDERTAKMPRKKTPTNTNTAAAAVNLDDDEQLVEEITTTKRIGRQRRTPASEEVITIDADDDESDEVETPEFAEGSLAAVLFGESSQTYDDQFCTIQIRRNPDSMNDRFLTPCGAVTNLPPLRNIELTADRMDIEDRVRAEYGGGHYFFQIYYDGAFRSSWKSTLADDPAAVARAKAEADAKNKPAQPELALAQTPPPDPMQSMIDSITKMKMLKDVMFGDEEKRLQREIDELKAKIAEKPEPSSEPKSEQLYILEKALGTANPSLQEKLLDYAFPADGGGHWIPETVKTIFDHKDEIGGILGGLLGGLAPKPTTPNIAAMLKQPAPAALPQPTEQAGLPTSNFRRRTQSASPPLADNSIDADDRSDASETSAPKIFAEAVEPTPEFIASVSITAADPFEANESGDDDFQDQEQTTDAE
jgi:hypothetical protein